MKKEFIIIVASFMFGVLVWVSDSALDSIFFYEGSFTELLILEIPRNELYFRTQVVIFFTLFGIIIARLFSTRKKAYLALQKAKIELENRVEKRTAKLLEANQLLNEEFAERIRVDNALTKSEERYRIVSELTTDFAYAFRVENEDTLSLEWVTEALYRITGFTRDELRLRGGWQSIVHPDDVGIVDNQLKTLLRGQSNIVQYRILTSKGDVRWLRDHGRSEWDKKESRATRIYGAVQNITERKQAVQADGLTSIIAVAVAFVIDAAQALNDFRQQLAVPIPRAQLKADFRLAAGAFSFITDVACSLTHLVNGLLRFIKQ